MSKPGEYDRIIVLTITCASEVWEWNVSRSLSIQAVEPMVDEEWMMKVMKVCIFVL